MDATLVIRTLGALGLTLGLLFAALWAVRRSGLRLPGQVGGGTLKRVELVERTALDGKRSVALLRRDGREHLILLSPEGNLVIESGIRQDGTDRKAQAEREAAADRQRREQQEALAAARAQLLQQSEQLVRAAATTLGRVREVAARRVGQGRGEFARLLEDSARAATSGRASPDRRSGRPRPRTSPRTPAR